MAGMANGHDKVRIGLGGCAEEEEEEEGEGEEVE